MAANKPASPGALNLCESNFCPSVQLNRTWKVGPMFWDASSAARPGDPRPGCCVICGDPPPVGYIFLRAHSALSSEHLRLQLNKPVAETDLVQGIISVSESGIWGFFSHISSETSSAPMCLETACFSVFSLRLTLLDFLPSGSALNMAFTNFVNHMYSLIFPY